MYVCVYMCVCVYVVYSELNHSSPYPLVAWQPLFERINIGSRRLYTGKHKIIQMRFSDTIERVCVPCVSGMVSAWGVPGAWQSC